MLSGEVPDTGELRGDVLALLRRVSRGLSRIGQETLFGLLSEVFRDAALSAAAVVQAQHVGADAMATILGRAAQRGEVRLDAITPRMVSLPVDLVRHELLVTRALVSERALAEIVDDIFLPLVRA